MAKFEAQLLWCYTIAIVTVTRQASTCGWVRAPGQTPIDPKQLRSDVHVEKLKSCQREFAADEIRGKKTFGERSNAISARLSTDGLSAMQNGLGLQGNSAPYRNQTYVAQFSTFRLNHYAKNPINLLGKTGNDLWCFASWSSNLEVAGTDFLDLHFRIAHVEHQGQMRYTKILEIHQTFLHQNTPKFLRYTKPFFDTY